MASTMENNCCFLCNNVNEVDGRFESAEDSQELFLILCKILNVSHLSNNLKKYECISYCHSCKRIMLNIWDSLKKLEELEKKVLEEKYLIHLLLEENYQNNFNNILQNSNEQFKFLSKLVTEIRVNSIKSRLTTILHKQFDKKACPRTKVFRIMKKVSIFKNIGHETVEENVSKFCTPDNLSSPLISDLIPIDQNPVLSDSFSNPETGPEHFEDEVQDGNHFNTSYNESELPLTSDVYDFRDMKIQTLKTESFIPTEVTDPFEGIVPESNCDEEDSKLETMIIDEIYPTNFHDSNQLDEQCRKYIKVKHFKCNLCPKVFLSQNLMRTHLATKHFKLKYCDKTFSYYKSNVEFNIKTKLKDHKLMNTEKIFKCEYCEKTFLTNYKRKSHERTHTDVSPYKCKYCEKILTSKADHKYHELGHVGKKPYMCEYCGKKIISIYNLKAHELRHTRNKSFQCVYCEKTFLTYYKKKSHEFTHTDVIPYKCKYCEKILTSKVGHKYHELRHVGKKPYMCEYCGKSFISISNLKTHELTHTRNKSFQCVYCEKFFYTLNQKKLHERIHTGEKPYMCQFCRKAYPSRSSMINHERTHKERKWKL